MVLLIDQLEEFGNTQQWTVLDAARAQLAAATIVDIFIDLPYSTGRGPGSSGDAGTSSGP